MKTETVTEAETAKKTGDVGLDVPRLVLPIDLIEAERARQIREIGYTREHDDEHVNGELALAAACYASGEKTDKLPEDWNLCNYRQEGDRMRDLAKAGALIVAEMERIQRAEQPDRVQSDTQQGTIDQAEMIGLLRHCRMFIVEQKGYSQDEKREREILEDRIDNFLKHNRLIQPTVI